MKEFLLKMFSDKSDINPKVVVGFISFVTMVIYGFTNIIIASIGNHFNVEPVIFNGLMYTTFGCLGIAGAEAIFGNKNLKIDENSK